MEHLPPESLEPVRINPAIIAWARGRLNLSVQDLAILLGQSPERVTSWEAGTGEPTYAQAIALARKLQFPFGYLFLSKEPKSVLPLPDLRTVAGEEPRAPSPNLLSVLEDAIRKQHWYSELFVEEGGKELPFVAKYPLRERTEVIAADIRQVLDINDQTRAECPSGSAFLTWLVRSAEASGIIVLRSGTVCGNPHRTLSVDEFRGFALVDKFAPIIFINSRDAVVAQLFTFAHEIAHLWIGAQGVSNLNFTKKSDEQVNNVEIKCNQIAAEVLVPTPGFTRGWSHSFSIEKNIDNLRMRYRVSRFVILRKAFDQNLVTGKQYKEKLNDFYEAELRKKQDKKDDSSGNYYNNLFARNSNKFTAAVTQAVSRGNLLITEACNLLGVGTGVLRKISTS